MQPKNKIFRTQHIKVEIRLPVENKALDLSDEYDLQEAKKQLYQEWLLIQEDVDRFFNVVQIGKELPE